MPSARSVIKGSEIKVKRRVLEQHPGYDNHRAGTELTTYSHMVPIQ